LLELNNPIGKGTFLDSDKGLQLTCWWNLLSYLKSDDKWAVKRFPFWFGQGDVGWDWRGLNRLWFSPLVLCTNRAYVEGFDTCEKSIDSVFCFVSEVPKYYHRSSKTVLCPWFLCNV
jgi:hypothetical protein